MITFRHVTCTANLSSMLSQRAGADFDEKCAAQRLALSECASLAVRAAHFAMHNARDSERFDACYSSNVLLQ